MSARSKFLFCFFLIFSLLSPAYSVLQDYAPYFDYSEENLKIFEDLSSTHQITISNLIEWDKIVEAHLKGGSQIAEENVRVYSYLYNAQRDFAFLSLQLKGSMMGSLDAISTSILRLFYPFFISPKELVLDQFSILLANLVFKKYQARFEAEKQKAKDFQNYETRTWQGYKLEYGKAILNWIPWKVPLFIIKTAKPPTTSEVEWASQLSIVKEETRNLTEQQKETVAAWGSFYGINWIELTNSYLFSEKVPLAKAIYVRSIMAMVIYDALIFAFEVKYTYMIMPPYLADTSIQPTLDVSNPHPSYFSSHAMVSEAAAQVLTYFFPKKRRLWEKYAKNSGSSRLWGGVNYPIDIEEARKQARNLFGIFEQEILRSKRR